MHLSQRWENTEDVREICKDFFQFFSLSASNAQQLVLSLSFWSCYVIEWPQWHQSKQSSSCGYSSLTIWIRGSFSNNSVMEAAIEQTVLRWQTHGLTITLSWECLYCQLNHICLFHYMADVIMWPSLVLLVPRLPPQPYLLFGETVDAKCLVELGMVTVIEIFVVLLDSR